MPDLVTFDVTNPLFKADPHEFYARLRESGPAHRVYLPGYGDVWLITTYADARAVLADPRLSKDPVNVPEALRKAMVEAGGQDNFQLMAHMLNSDPPDHTRLRKLVVRAFTARRVRELRPRIQEITDALLDEVVAKGSADLIDDLAFPLPITVICELLGVPTADQEDFRRWTSILVSEDEELLPQLQDAFDQLNAYMTDLVGRKHTEQDDGLLSALVSVAEDGDSLTDAEVVWMAFLLLVAGHETTVNLIGNGLLALLRHPGQLAALRADESLLPAAVEEMLRYDGPVETATWRFTTGPVKVGDVVIPSDESLLVVLASADRDPGRFPAPDTFDIGRADNQHVAFGHGIHYCLGAPLARLEGQVAIGSVLRRLPDLALAVEDGDLEWRLGVVMRGLRNLPVRFTPGFVAR
ncbi:cytochrome P450 [Streptomyces sp. NPDC037389]|uniref:cytochrome P450 family protein n=1 Tax=Streptomyces sp. NPDC037389 TaxID=3155369 RepID=UPI003403D3FB